jgi:hypothetical protein
VAVSFEAAMRPDPGEEGVADWGDPAVLRDLAPAVAKLFGFNRDGTPLADVGPYGGSESGSESEG